MRFKKQIAMICLFTFLFLPISGKYEEPKAEILTLTTGAIIACAALATACGVVITHPDMLHDVGERVYNGIKSIPGAIEQVGDKVKVNIIPGVISSTISVLQELPVSDYFFTKYNDFSLDDEYDEKGRKYFALSDFNYRKFDFVFKPGSKSYNAGISLQTGVDFAGTICSYYLVNKFSTNTISLEMSKEITGKMRCKLWLNGDLIHNVLTSSFSEQVVTLILSNNGFELASVSGSLDESICIPYTPENSQNVSNDKVQQSFPLGSGSISAPIDKPLSDYNVSVDKPITIPSDLVSEGDIIVDKSDTGVLDKPNTDVVDSPVTGNNLWDSLMEFLKKLFAPLLALLGWIGDILMSILDFLKGLLDGLIEALSKLFKYLFVPTLDPSSLILIPDDSGLGQLIQLFDWGDLLDIIPKPYIFETNININSLVDNESTVWNLRFDLFSNESVDKYIPYVRNILSYSCLIGVIYFVIIHFLPKRDID